MEERTSMEIDSEKLETRSCENGNAITEYTLDAFVNRLLNDIIALNMKPSKTKTDHERHDRTVCRYEIHGNDVPGEETVHSLSDEQIVSVINITPREQKSPEELPSVQKLVPDDVDVPLQQATSETEGHLTPKAMSKNISVSEVYQPNGSSAEIKSRQSKNLSLRNIFRNIFKTAHSSSPSEQEMAAIGKGDLGDVHTRNIQSTSVSHGSKIDETSPGKTMASTVPNEYQEEAGKQTLEPQIPRPQANRSTRMARRYFGIFSRPSTPK